MQKKKSIKLSHGILKFNKFIMPYKLLIFATVMCIITIAFVNIANSYVIKNLTDKALNEEYDEFLSLFYITILLTAVNIAVSFAKAQLNQRYITYITRDIRNALINKIQKLPMYFFDDCPSGDIITTLNRDVTTVVNFINSAVNLVYQPLIFIGAAIFIWYINWKLLLVIMLLVPFSSPLYYMISKPMRKNSGILREQYKKANSFSYDIIKGIHIVKSFNLKNIVSGKYNCIAGDIYKTSLRLEKINIFLYFAGSLIKFFPILVCPIYGGYLTYRGEMTIAGLLVVGTMLKYISGPVEAILSFIAGSQQVIPSVEKIQKIFEHEPEQKTVYSYTKESGNDPIEFSNVSFAYNKETNILKNINFSVDSGKVIAIVGPSGGGKTTIFKLLCGFYKPQSGTVKVFGNDIGCSNLTDIRSKISLVSQDTKLFEGTIEKNIAFGKNGATMDEIIAAAKLANAHEFIVKMPEGYNTLLKEQGSNLSGGQRQRIAFARAILKNAPILLLDEPTSALDTQAEAVFQEALEEFRGRCTIMVIAHRISTIKSADEIYVLDRGQIVERGTYQELLNNDGLFAKLHHNQFSQSSYVV